MSIDLERIADDNRTFYGTKIETYGPVLLSKLYSDPTHFIFELIQNAEDADATEIEFLLKRDQLEVRHNGRPFNEKDIRGICGLVESTKSDDLTKIGQFGIGFKSVYAYTTRPCIFSEDISFAIEKFVSPQLIENCEECIPGQTLFILPFDRDNVKPDVAMEAIGNRLRNLRSRTLLFLKKLKEIQYHLPDKIKGAYLREEKEIDDFRQVTVIGECDGRDDNEDWLLFSREVENSEANSVVVEIGFRLRFDVEKEKGEVVRIQDSPLYVYFPTEKDTYLGFLVQGPYRTTPARENVPKDDIWNKTLVAESAILLRDTLLVLRDKGYMTVSLLESLPIRLDNHPEGTMFQPFLDATRESLLTVNLLPANDGTFVSASHAKLARSNELRNLLEHEKLGECFGEDKATRWLIPGITQDRAPDLRNYLLRHLEIDEITPEIFARQLSREFMESMTDEWVLKLYGFLNSQPALKSILQSSYIVRLSDNSHVPPFDDSDNSSPNAYLSPESLPKTTLPMVKHTFAQDNDSLKLLQSIGVPEFDIVAEVIETTLPKYCLIDNSISLSESLNDLEQIGIALNTDSSQSRYRLLAKISTTPLVATDDDSADRFTFQSPNLLYIDSNELRQYFSENLAGRFASSQYPPSIHGILKKIGVKEQIEINRKDGNSHGHVQIHSNHGRHTRGLDGFDPNIEVDGLAEALEMVTPEVSEFIWNHIASPNSMCIRGVVESSTRQTYEGSQSKEGTSKNFGELLIETKWLPMADGEMKKPSQISIDELPESFRRDDKLSEQLGMIKNTARLLADAIGISSEDIEFIRNNPSEFLDWKKSRIEAQSAPEFPSKPMSNPEKRTENIGKERDGAPDKNYSRRERSVRTTRNTIDPSTWLINQYTNDDEQLICQICKECMPFLKRNGRYYFETVEIFSNELLHQEHESQYLALCPLCAARYNEFVKLDVEVMRGLHETLVLIEDSEIPVNLGNLETSIRFVERHLHDLKLLIDGRKQDQEIAD